MSFTGQPQNRKTITNIIIINSFRNSTKQCIWRQDIRIRWHNYNRWKQLIWKWNSYSRINWFWRLWLSNPSCTVVTIRCIEYKRRIIRTEQDWFRCKYLYPIESIRWRFDKLSFWINNRCFRRSCILGSGRISRRMSRYWKRSISSHCREGAQQQYKPAECLPEYNLPSAVPEILPRRASIGGLRPRS